jgi:hypothetical protein
MFIKDITPEMLDLHITKFCALTGMEYIDLTSMIYPMVLEKYGKYDAAIFPNAFKEFVISGRKAPSKFAFNFICGVLNEYIQDNHTKIPRIENKREYTPKLPSPDEMEKIFQNNFSRCTTTWINVWYSQKMEMLSLMVMNIVFKGLVERGLLEDNFDQGEVYQMMDWVSNYEQRYIQHLKGLNRNPYAKTIYETLTLVADKNKQDKTLEGAAKFAIYINTKNNI